MLIVGRRGYGMELMGSWWIRNVRVEVRERIVTEISFFLFYMINNIMPDDIHVFCIILT